MSLCEALSLDGCHSCRPQPSTIPAMTVHLCADGIQHEFRGWYTVVVHAAEEQNQDTESGEEDGHSLQDFIQDKTYFVLNEHQVLNLP